MADLTALKRRRGVVKASITRLATEVTELEATEYNLSIAARAQQEIRETDFKTHHFSVIDASDDEELVGAELDVPDQHNDDIYNQTLSQIASVVRLLIGYTCF